MKFDETTLRVVGVVESKRGHEIETVQILMGGYCSITHFLNKPFWEGSQS